jgi:glycosyltransferase involved in cell wall biosynthesis
MKIGIDARFLTHPQRGGFKTYTQNLLNALADFGEENQYVVYIDRKPSAADALPDRSNMTYVVVGGTLPIIGVPMREQVSLRKRIGNDRLDLVHFLCNTATVGLRTRHVLTLHDTIQVESTGLPPLTRGLAATQHWAQTAYSRSTIRPVVRSASQVIAVSRYERDMIHQVLSVPLEKISVTYEAAAASDLQQGRNGTMEREVLQRLGARGRFLLGVGYESRKNIPLLIQAFGNLVSTIPDLRLVLVAARVAEREAFRILLEGMGLAHKTLVLGMVSPEELAVLYRAADVFVFPSEREAFGLPVLEAMAAGTPTVAMKCSSIPEIAGDAAVLVDGTDAPTWAEAIYGVLSDDALRIRLRRQGLERASHFTWRRCAEETLAVYREVRARKAEAATSD